MASSEKLPESSLILPQAAGGYGMKAVHLLVMGLAGAGKSTFVSKATGDTSIPIGPSIFGVTQDVVEYIMYHHGVEVHLIDSPGFADAGLSDHEVLSKISEWINTVYSQGWTMGGILLIYDITRVRLEGSGEQNIRVLEAMTGKDRWKHISLISTKWHCSADHAAELSRENELKSHVRAWGPMLQGERPAHVAQFHNTHESALEIVQWHLDQAFAPELARQMADPAGPQLTLGTTDAGRIVMNNVTAKLQVRGDHEAQRRVEEIFGRRFNRQQAQLAVLGMLAQLDKAKKEQRNQRIGRWAVRMCMVGGAITLFFVAPGILGAGATAGGKLNQSMIRHKKMKEAEVTAIENAITEAILAGPSQSDD